MYCFVGVAILFIIFRYLWGALLPFLVSYLFAECFRPVVRYSERNERFPKRFFVLFVVILAAVSIAFLIYAVMRRLVFEVTSLLDGLKYTVELIRTDDVFAYEMIEKINSFIPFFDVRERLWEMRSNLDEELLGMALSFGEKLSGGIISFLKTAVAFIPKTILNFVVIIISTYYFAIDRVKINCFFLSLFPKSVRRNLKKGKDALSETAGKYLHAYGLLFLITFGELLLAFLVLGIDYSFLLAFLIAIVDILPVLGTGTVLIPWALVLIFSGSYTLGTGLLIAYAVITVVRQVIEPKIVGKFIGISPLAALASMYIGLELMGIVGIFTFPIGAIILKRLIEYFEREKGISV
jgi:sporulation integral membrane protein YtvI